MFAVLFVLLGEIAAHWCMPALPLEGVYGSHRLRQKVDGFAAALHAGPVDVLFLGSSIVDHGISPARFEKRCRQAGASPASYNLGITGPSMRGVVAVLERFFLAQARPRLVYIGVSPNAFNRNRARFVEEITQRFEKTAQLSPWQETLGHLLDHSYLYAYRRDLAAWLTSGGHSGFADREYGEPDGFAPRVGVMVYNNDYAARLGTFVPGPRDVAALEQLIRWCRIRGAFCVVVDMPLSTRCRRQLSSAQQAAYAAVLARVARQGANLFTFQPTEFLPDQFYDGMHLNMSGAAHLSDLLAADAVRRLAELPGI